MDRQVFSQFYKKSLEERLSTLEHHHLMNTVDADSFRNGRQVLSPHSADRMVENVIGVFGLPIGLGLHLSVNGRDYVVPMAVEEPSIIAAVSAAAKLVRSSGGFETVSSEPLAIGQIVIEHVEDPEAKMQKLLDRKDEILNLANSLHPKLVGRGGGALDLDVSILQDATEPNPMIRVHLKVDTRDAMGANLVNSMCEGVAELIESTTGGQVLLRILSNLCDGSIVQAKAKITPNALGRNGWPGEAVRDRIVAADRFARVDRYRAATHNKGIMNGIDAVAIATGNDWRAIEAAAHAYAARDGRYRALTRWEADDSGNLVGHIALPLNVGIVGGSLEANPAVRMALRLLKVNSSRELAEVMAAVGLAQNLAALRALVTEGIQKGHMRLHARSVAFAAGVDPQSADTVVDRLVDSGEIKVWKAREIIESLRTMANGRPNSFKALQKSNPEIAEASASGKIILLGEHAVLYGSRALAAPVPLAMRARIYKDGPGIRLIVKRWHIDKRWEPNKIHRDSVLKAIDTILLRLGVTRPALRIEIHPQVPRAMGLGSSAAAAVAVIRALSGFYGLSLTHSEVNAIAYESERIIHGNTSGLDNAIASYGKPLVFRAGRQPEMSPLSLPSPIPIIVGLSSKESLTAPMVARVAAACRQNGANCDALFQRVDRQVADALDAIAFNNLQGLGRLMNANHNILRSLGASTEELEAMVMAARGHGAIGAKITGAGGGGAIIALSPGAEKAVVDGLQAKGWSTLRFSIDGNDATSDQPTESENQMELQDQLIMVDEADTITGYCTREQCHSGDGIRHRAFSIFIFNRRGQLLLQQRSAEKQLWPLFWSNSCCSHPRVGETTEGAAHRRLNEELGISAPLTYLYKFSYQARYQQAGSENELCSVFVGKSDEPIDVDPKEVNAWRYVSPGQLNREIEANPNRFTPWFKMEWAQLRNHPMVTSFQRQTT